MSDDIKARPLGEYLREQADRIEALEAENARLRGALEVVCDTRPMWEGGIRGPSVTALENALSACHFIARAALTQDNPTRDQGAGDQAAEGKT